MYRYIYNVRCYLSEPASGIPPVERCGKIRLNADLES